MQLPCAGLRSPSLARPVVVRRSPAMCSAAALRPPAGPTRGPGIPIALAVLALLTACSSGPVIIREGPLPAPAPAPAPPSPPPVTPLPAPLPVPLPAPAPRPPAWPPLPPAPVAEPSAVSAAEVRALADRAVPATVRDRAGWAADIATSFAALGIAAQPHKVCALAAVVEQESGWQADPVVPNLARIARAELDKKRAGLGIPAPVFELALRKTSPDGRSYAERLQRLRTERELSALYEDIVQEIPFGAQLLGDSNPVRTGGATQVGIAWAAEHMRAQRYPWPKASPARQEVFKRRGAVYFGAAMLLDYPVSYNRMLYRFADYNAGRYASRNAALQTLLAQLTGRPVVPDGDLLRYRDGQPLPAHTDPSQAYTAALQLADALGLSRDRIEADLRLEKRFEFERSATWHRLWVLAERRGIAAPGADRARLPDIALQSPKISRPLTTARFAQRCEARYRSCLARLASGAQPSGVPDPQAP